MSVLLEYQLTNIDLIIKEFGMKVMLMPFFFHLKVIPIQNHE